MIGENGTPETPQWQLPGRVTDWSRLYCGDCPSCGEYAFIGHGPLCVDCYLTACEAAEQHIVRGDN